MTAVLCVVHDRHVHGKPFTLWSACELRPAAKSLFNGHIYRILLLIDECSCSVYVEIAPSGLVKSHHHTALTAHFQLNKRTKKKKIYILRQPPSLILSIAQLHYPWGGIGQGTESMGGTFPCHSPPLGGSVLLEEPTSGIRKGLRRGGRIRNDLSGHGRPALAADRWSETSHFWNESLSAADLEWGIQDLNSCYNAHQQCINSYGST